MIVAVACSWPEWFYSRSVKMTVRNRLKRVCTVSTLSAGVNVWLLVVVRVSCQVCGQETNMYVNACVLMLLCALFELSCWRWHFSMHSRAVCLSMHFFFFFSPPPLFFGSAPVMLNRPVSPLHWLLWVCFQHVVKSGGKSSLAPYHLIKPVEQKRTYLFYQGIFQFLFLLSTLFR